MSEIAIRARNVTKAYRLHDSPGERLLDLFGILKDADRKVKKHLALQDVSFDIYRGEKIAIIGRNGAGKSTLLKMITRVTEPTSGTLEVRGQSRALLQIGTGFHFDFTGRENVAAYLASLGVDDKAALPLIEDAIAFAELEEFADQPVKTYSTGMAMRLMFAASTMMKPDLLVIDEVLGVGDAYFQRKSFERIREMCDGRETTLILVTHDIYSAAALCDRMIWIDRGRVLIDADPPTVMRAYEDAMREQEERRLRQKALKASAERGEKARKERVIVEIQTRNNQPPAAPVWISRLQLLRDGAPIASLRFGDDAFQDTEGGKLIAEGTSWSDPQLVDGRLARSLRTHGSAFHKVSGIFELGNVGDLDPHTLSVGIDYICNEHMSVKTSLSAADWRLDLGLLPDSNGQWIEHVAASSSAQEPAQPSEDGEQHMIGEVPTWANWTAVIDGVGHEVDEQALKLSWNGAAGPYLMMTPPIQLTPHETIMPTFTADVASGRLGVGALNREGQWISTYEFGAGREIKALPFTADKTGLMTLVLYSAAPTKLQATLTQGEAAAASVNTTGIYGAGDLRITRVRVLNNEGREALILRVGAAATFELGYRISRSDMKERAQVVLAFKRRGTEDVFRVICDTLLFDAAAASEGVVVAALDPFPLAPGDYTITVLVAAEGYYEEPQTLFFSINPKVYFAQSVAAEITVDGVSQIHQGTAVVGAAAWRLAPVADTAPPLRSIPAA